MEHLVHNLDEMRDFASSFLKDVNKLAGTTGAQIVALYGDLGSGKTAFVKELAKELGIEHHITSPTFVILKKYQISNNYSLPTNYYSLIHIDAYRLGSGEDLKTLGWNELVKDPKNLILIEWPEQVKDALPNDMIKIQFEYVDQNIRKLIF